MGSKVKEPPPVNSFVSRTAPSLSNSWNLNAVSGAPVETSFLPEIATLSPPGV